MTTRTKSFGRMTLLGAVALVMAGCVAEPYYPAHSYRNYPHDYSYYGGYAEPYYPANNSVTFQFNSHDDHNDHDRRPPPPPRQDRDWHGDHDHDHDDDHDHDGGRH